MTNAKQNQARSPFKIAKENGYSFGPLRGTKRQLLDPQGQSAGWFDCRTLEMNEYFAALGMK